MKTDRWTDGHTRVKQYTPSPSKRKNNKEYIMSGLIWGRVRPVFSQGLQNVKKAKICLYAKMLESVLATLPYQ